MKIVRNNMTDERAVEILSRYSSIPNDGESFSEVIEAYDYAIEKIKADRWIPVTERLPDEDGQYEVTREEYIPSGSDYHTFDTAGGAHWEMVVDLARFEGHYNRANGLENYNNGFNKAYRVHAWRPLPEAYKKNEGE